MNNKIEIIAGESFGVTVMIYRRADGRIAACGCGEDTGCDGEPMDITGLGVRCQVSTTPLGDRLRGGVPSEEGDDFVVERRAAANNAFYFDVDRAATARLSPGELTLAIFLSTEEWMDIAETVIGRVVKLR